MRPLIRHLFENNFDEILAKSLLNCHVKGLHSIMLLDCPGKTIRLYIAVPGNELWRNMPDFNTTGILKPLNKQAMSLAFHPHHCALTLECVRGTLVNWVVKKSDIYSGFYMDQYGYKSKINTGDLAFDYQGAEYLKSFAVQKLFPGDAVFMPANQIHTVSTVNTGEVTAWLVYEGKEDPDYKSVCYSNFDLNRVDETGLYQKPTRDQIEALLNLIPEFRVKN